MTDSTSHKQRPSTPTDSGPADPRRRKVLQAGVGAAATLAMPAIVRADPKVLYINSQGGVWEAAARKNLFDPFTKATGIAIKTTTGASIAKLALQVRSGVHEFDLQTVGAPNVIQAEEANLLEPLNRSIITPGSVPANLILEGGVCDHAYSTNICFNTKKFAPGSIKTWKDFWDQKRFPGARSLGREMSQTMVFALLADGVPRDKLYPIDLDRVFHSLDKIKDSVRVWWSTGPQIRELLGGGEVDMGSVWHAHGVALRDSGAPVEIVWNEFTMDRTYWIVSKGTPRADYAWEFIKFALQPKNNAGFCLDGSYGPVNPAAFQYLTAEQSKNMPTNPKYASGAIEYDGRQMGLVLTQAERRFQRWLQQ